MMSFQFSLSLCKVVLIGWLNNCSPPFQLTWLILFIHYCYGVIFWLVDIVWLFVDIVWLSTCVAQAPFCQSHLQTWLSADLSLSRLDSLRLVIPTLLSCLHSQKSTNTLNKTLNFGDWNDCRLGKALAVHTANLGSILDTTYGLPRPSR